MRQAIKKPSSGQQRRQKKIDSYHRTATEAQRQIKKLFLSLGLVERQKLRRYIRPVDGKIISRAIELDQKIRGLNGN